MLLKFRTVYSWSIYRSHIRPQNPILYSQNIYGNANGIYTQFHANENFQLLGPRPYFSNYCHHCQNRYFSSTSLDAILEFQSKLFLSMSQSTAVETFMKGILYIHEVTGMSWWLTIITATVGLRFFLTFPLTVYQNYIIGKVENLHIEMKSLIKQLGMETTIAIKKYGYTEVQAKQMHMRSARRIWRELIERENCHPAKGGLILLFQIPLWIMGSMSYRNFASMMPHNDANAQLVFLELSVGGFGWLPNLTELDHSLILPIFMGITNLLIIEVNRLSHSSVDTRWKKIVTNFFRCFSIVLIPIAASMPGCVVLYWTTSSVYGLVQNLMLLHPKVRRLCRIPLTPSEKPKPYSSMYNKLIKKS